MKLQPNALIYVFIRISFVLKMYGMDSMVYNILMMTYWVVCVCGAYD